MKVNIYPSSAEGGRDAKERKCRENGKVTAKEGRRNLLAMSKEDAEHRNIIKLLRTKDDTKLLEGLRKSEGEGEYLWHLREYFSWLPRLPTLCSLSLHTLTQSLKLLATLYRYHDP